MLVRRFVVFLCLFAVVPALSAQTFTYTNLHAFTTADGNLHTNVIQASDGNLYGTNEYGGTTGFGNVFRATLAGTVSNVYSFCPNSDSCPDGEYPRASVIEGTDGNLYGTTYEGGAYGQGSVFKLTTSGTLTTLYSFCPVASTCADGEGPVGLVQGNDGNFYGTTQSGGAEGDGAVFKITSTGELTIYSFCSISSSGSCGDGSLPVGGLVQGADGNFYGVTEHGGANDPAAGGAGTLFKVTPTGTLTTVYSFCAVDGSDCTDGEFPSGDLIQGTNGSFYGVTSSGGANGGGTAFAVASGGTLSTVYNFCEVGLCTDGISPTGALFLASNGDYYGVAGAGANSGGVLYQLTAGGTETVAYAFCSVGGSSCTDGEDPEDGVVQGSDGSFYGTTTSGGTNDAGVLYKVTASPAEKAAVQLTLSASSVASGSQFTLSYLVSNAYSDTLKYCFATNTAANTTWTGAKTGSATSQLVTLTAPTAAGTYTYTLTCGGQETGIAALTVIKSNTSTVMSATPNPAQVGQPVTLTATVTKTTGAGVPTGKVTFYYNTLVVGTGTLNDGVATFVASSATVPSGDYALTASYAGDSGDNASTSSAYVVALDKATTSTTLTASPNPVTPPASVKLTATVTRTASGATGYPGGTVTFSSGTVTLGTATLMNGVATFSASSNNVPANSYPVIAKYGGNASDGASTSAAVTVVVK